MALARAAAAWFRRKDYERFRQMADDADDLPATFDEWEKGALQQVARFAAQGIAVEKVVLDPDEFAAWCANAKVKPEQKARAAFARARLADEKPGNA